MAIQCNAQENMFKLSYLLLQNNRDVTGTRKSGRFRVGSGRVSEPDPKFLFSRVDSGYSESNQNFFFQLRAESGACFFFVYLFHLLYVFRPSYQLTLYKFNI
jgi:hypothetical protein